MAVKCVLNSVLRGWVNGKKNNSEIKNVIEEIKSSRSTKKCGTIRGKDVCIFFVK